jgi:hypothetical protein
MRLKHFTEEEASKLHMIEEHQLDYVDAIGYTLSPPDEKGFETVTYYGKSLHDIIGSTKDPDWLYVLANSSVPGILKIGYTTLSVDKRVSQINAATGVITKWFPVFTYRCASGYFLEQEVHKFLQGYGFRVNPAREGFYIDVDTAIHVIRSIGEQYKIAN